MSTTDEYPYEQQDRFSIHNISDMPVRMAVNLWANGNGPSTAVNGDDLTALQEFKRNNG